MKKIILLLLLCCPMMMMMGQRAHSNRSNSDQYLAGAVPVVDGYVQFDKTYYVKNKSKAEIMDSLQSFVQKELVEGPDQLPQARITEVTPDSGIIAASIEEYLYFKRTNWQIHRVRFFYQLVFRVEDGKFDVTMRRLHYKYDPEVTAGEIADDRRAENWITDDVALSKDGKKLTRISAKFRTFTIDRKNEIFRNAALAAGARLVRKVTKTVEVEEEE